MSKAKVFCFLLSIMVSVCLFAFPEISYAEDSFDTTENSIDQNLENRNSSDGTIVMEDEEEIIDAEVIQEDAELAVQTINPQVTSKSGNNAQGEPEANQSDEEDSDAPDMIVDSGECGNGVNWVLTSDGTLTVSGNGGMNNYTTPWASYVYDIKTVIVEEGITHIGAEAFSDCKAISSVSLPSSLESIGQGAFSSCSGLTGSFTIPQNVTSIGSYAFYQCTAITSISLPSSLESIGKGAFCSCSGLTGALVIPQKVERIEKNTFSGCKGFSTLSLPAGLTYIGRNAFSECNGLTGTLELPNSLKEIGFSAFSGCGFTGDLIIPDSVVTIDDYAFWNCNGIQDLVLSHNLISIGTRAFKTNDGLKTPVIVIPSTVTSIGEDAFCLNCTNCIVVFEGDAPVISASPFVSPTRIIYNNDKDGWTDNWCDCESYGYTTGEELTVPATKTYAGAYIPADDSGSFSSLVENIPAISSVSKENIKYYYTGEEIKPAVIVKDVNGQDIDSRFIKIEYSNNLSVTTSASITVTGVDRYSFIQTLTFSISPGSLSNTDIHPINKEYNGVAGEILFYSKLGLQEGVDFTVSTCYKEIFDESTQSWYIKEINRDEIKNQGTYYVDITGKGNFRKTTNHYLPFCINPISLDNIDDDDIKFIKNSYVYTGKEIKPDVVISNNLITRDDYEIVYTQDGSNCYNVKNVGYYSAIILGCGNFSGQKTLNDGFYITPATVKVPSGKNLLFTGKERQGVASNSGYSIIGNKARNAGTYYATLDLINVLNYKWSDGTTGSKTVKWIINKAANPLAVTGKTATIKYSKVKKKAQKIAANKVISFQNKGQGKVTYTKTSGNKKITINKNTGQVSIKKGLKKGTYKLKVNVKAAGNNNYKASSAKTATITIKVKK